MTLNEAKQLEIPYYDYVYAYASNTTGSIITMDYNHCFKCIQAKHADANFDDFYSTYMLICYNI